MASSQERRVALKAMLEERRRELKPHPIGIRLRGEKVDGLEVALEEMRQETLAKIGIALQRLELNQFGYCYDCGDEIDENRLRALPFAVRCMTCNEMHEQETVRRCVLAERRAMGMFPW